MTPERLAGVDVGQVHLDKGDADRRQGVAQRNAGVRVGRRVGDDEACALFARGLHPVDQRALAVALETAHLDPEAATCRPQARIDLAQRLAAVNFRFPCPKQVQVGPMQYQDDGLGLTLCSHFCASRLHFSPRSRQITECGGRGVGPLCPVTRRSALGSQ